MADHQRKIKPSLKRLLIEKAGGKCANPGCSNWRLHLHHIKHWAVYKVHNESDMIAVCPSCHDAAHHGELSISDDQLYEWKKIIRPKAPNTVHLYAEPAPVLKLLTGSVCIEPTNNQTIVFELSNSNHLAIRVVDGDLLQVSVRLIDAIGNEFLKVVENNVRVNRSKKTKFDFRPGRFRITLPVSDPFIPNWMLEQIRNQNPSYSSNGWFVVLDIEVVKPGTIRIQGCWPDGDVGVVITEDSLSFCTRGWSEPFTIIGSGESTVFVCAGPITKAIFKLSPMPFNYSMHSDAAATRPRR